MSTPWVGSQCLLVRRWLVLVFGLVGCGPRGGDASEGSGSGASEGSAGEESTVTGDSQDEDQAACFEAWREPKAVVEADAAVSTWVAMRLRFAYVPGVVSLVEIAEDGTVLPSDGPFSVETNAGSWVELRDAADQTLYTRLVLSLIPESLEATGPLGQIPSCPESGSIVLGWLPNDPRASHIVFFQEAIDGRMTNVSTDLLRFELPAP